MSALTLFEILKFNEPIRSSILPARASALFSLFADGSRRPRIYPAREKGGAARAFVIRFNGSLSLRPFRILDRSKASTVELRRHRATISLSLSSFRSTRGQLERRGAVRLAVRDGAFSV